MSSVPVSGRLKLSPKAEQSFQQAKKVHGGQTRFLEQAVEHFVIGPQTFEKLNNIESLVCLLAENMGLSCINYPMMINKHWITFDGRLHGVGHEEVLKAEVVVIVSNCIG